MNYLPILASLSDKARFGDFLREASAQSRPKQFANPLSQVGPALRAGREFLSQMLHRRTQHAAFPLTPALSLGERETRTPACEYFRRVRFFEALATILPLPRGEGRGEGKEIFQPHGVQVLRQSRRAGSTLVLARGDSCPQKLPQSTASPSHSRPCCSSNVAADRNVRAPRWRRHRGAGQLLRGLLLGLVLATCLETRGQDGPHAGFLFDEFNLTLAPGHRTEALGPLFYSEQKESQHTLAVPGLFSYTRDPGTESMEIDFLYPVMTYDRFGDQYRWQLCQIWSFSGSPTQTESKKDRFTLFPVYFQQRSADPSQDYTAVFPFYGTLRHHLFRDEIHFIIWPLYCQTKKKDVVTDNYLVPFIHSRHGDGLHGWQFWPLIGNEHKDVTTQTNGFGDVKTIAGHDSFFALWPLWFTDRSGIGTTNAAREYASLPLYSVLRSPQRDSTTVIWPFFNYVDDRVKKYREWDAPWPLIVFARGEGKTTTRVWPFFSQAHSPTLESSFYLWPIYKHNAVQSDPLDRHRTRICFFLYSDQTDRNTETEAYRRRVDFLPFYTYKHDLNGNTRLQILTVFEPFMPTSKSIERDYSPLWSLWRSENNPRTHASSQSLLWNLYRREATPESKKCSLLFGLFQYQSGSKGKNLRLFYVPLSKSRPPAKGEAAPAPPTER